MTGSSLEEEHGITAETMVRYPTDQLARDYLPEGELPDESFDDFRRQVDHEMLLLIFASPQHVVREHP